MPSNAQFMQCHECLEQNSWIERAVIDGFRFTVQLQQLVYGRLCRADGVFDSEHDIIRLLAILANEGEVMRTLGDDLGPVTFLPRHELTGYEGHHAGNANR